MVSTWPNLTAASILRWADAHRRRTGKWPSPASGPLADVPGESWQAINNALHRGCRGLPGGDSLARLLVRRGRRPVMGAAGAWTPAQDQLLRTLSPAEAARRTGRPLPAIYRRRHLLRLPDARVTYRRK
jgi:hypothetical protein